MEIKRIGIAGYMGAGKSTCATIISEYFRACSHNVRIIDADAEAKSLMQGDTALKIELAYIFGKEILIHDALDFSVLGCAAFKTAESLVTLNHVVHPLLVEKLKDLVFSVDGTIIICDAALIPLWNIEKWFDALVWVHATFENRLDRICKRTALSSNNIARRMQLQQALFAQPDCTPWSIVENQGTIIDLEKQVLKAICL